MAASSSTSSPTSASSSTSDAPASPALGSGRLAGLVRLTHPFPSLLDAAATVTIATLAGADPGTALRLGASMLALQASIGALNDLVDAGGDSSRKPGKPIPRGAVTFGEATALVLVAAALGLVLSAVSGPATFAAAAAGVACGYAYDLRLSRTAWSWLPLALGLPILPIHAWLGATGSVPAGLLGLLPLGVLAGAGLSIGNGLADAERDAASGRRSAVVLAGPSRAWTLHAVALVGVLGLAWGLGPRPADEGAGAAWLVATGLGSVLVLLGLGLARARRPGLRERGWELEAMGVALVGAAWIGGLAAGAPAA